MKTRLPSVAVLLAALLMISQLAAGASVKNKEEAVVLKLESSTPPSSFLRTFSVR